MPMIPTGSRYVALGSSFAAGPGIEPVVDQAAGRSGRNYAHLVAERAGLVLRDVSYSGAVSGDLLRSNHGVPAQLDAIDEDVRLVTMTIGGNDLGYLGGLIKASLLNRLPGRLPLVGQLVGRFAPRLARIGTDLDALQALSDSLTAAVGAIAGRAPSARLLIVDYLSVAGGNASPEIPGPEIPLTSTQWRQAQAMARALSAVYAAVAERTRAQQIAVDVIDCATPSRTHHAASAEPWVTGWTGLRASAPYHPNAAGMAAVAELILARL